MSGKLNHWGAKVEKPKGVISVCWACDNFRVAPGGESGCISQKVCGSPMVGFEFDDYRGELTPEWIKNHCFICGAKGSKIIRSKRSRKGFGVCAAHLRLLANGVRAMSRRPGVRLIAPATEEVVVKDESGSESLLGDNAPRVPEKTLGKLLKAINDGDV